MALHLCPRQLLSRVSVVHSALLDGLCSPSVASCPPEMANFRCHHNSAQVALLTPRKCLKDRYFDYYHDAASYSSGNSGMFGMTLDCSQSKMMSCVVDLEGLSLSASASAKSNERHLNQTIEARIDGLLPYCHLFCLCRHHGLLHSPIYHSILFDAVDLSAGAHHRFRVHSCLLFFCLQLA